MNSIAKEIIRISPIIHERVKASVGFIPELVGTHMLAAKEFQNAVEIGDKARAEKTFKILLQGLDNETKYYSSVMRLCVWGDN